MADDVGLVTGFKLVTGEEIVFTGIRSEQFGKIFDIPPAVKIAGAEEWSMFGHLIGDPYVVIPSEPHMGRAWRLEPWPRIRRPGTCDEIFVKDRDVMFQLMTTEIDTEVLELYSRTVAASKWRDPYA